MRNLLNSRKAQFFVLTALIIVLLLYLMSRWVNPSTIPDTSNIATNSAIFLFNNIAEKSSQTVHNSIDCHDIAYNLQEYKNFAENFALQQGYQLYFNYTSSPCYVNTPVIIVSVNQTLTAPNIYLNSVYDIPWPS